MPLSEWKEYKLEDVTEQICRGITPNYTDSNGCRIINQKCIREGKISFKDSRLTDHNKKSITENKKLKNTDTLVCSTGVGTLGRVGVFREPFIDCITADSHVMIVRPNEDIINPRFLGYNLISRQREIEALAEGSTGQTELSRILLGNLLVNLPPLSEQQTIAEILGSLDDKIELNSQMSKTFEEMVHSIFKSWFVDFDPIKAKAEGKTIEGLSQEILDLFPDSFEESELGDIPQGWTRGKFDDVAEIIGGGTPSTKIVEYFCSSGEGVAWLTPKDLSGYNFKYIGRGNTDITEAGLKNSSAKLMPAESVLFTSRAPIGYIVIAENEICTNQGFKSLIPKENMVTEYLYQYIKHNLNIIESRASGSTFKEVSGSVMKEIPILIPQKSVLEKFEEILLPLNGKMKNIKNEIQMLSNIRDLLLPKLISGEIRVPKSEKILEDNF